MPSNDPYALPPTRTGANNNMQSSQYSDEDGETAIEEALECVRTAVKWRQTAKYDDTWAKLIKLYASRYEYGELAGYDDVIAPNMLFSTANVIIPSVSVNYPKITVTPRRQEDQDRAATVEAVANYEWQHNEVHTEFGLAVKDFVILGHGWCKTTWLYEEATRDYKPGEFQQAAMDAVQKSMADKQAAFQAGSPTNDFPTPEQIVSALPKKIKYAKEDRPNVERLSIFDVYVDPDATRVKDALWIAQRMYVPLEKAQKRKDWRKSARDSLKPTAMSEAKKDIDITFQGEDRGKEADYAVIWEYYDLINNTVCTFGDQATEFLSDPVEVPYTFPHPFVMLRNYDIPDKFYPLGDVEAIAPLQMELATTRTQMVNDRKRFRRMYLYRSGEIGPDGLAAFESGDDNILIEVEGQADFHNVFAPVQTTALPPEFYNQTSMILEDINLVSGVSEYQRGAVSEIRRTATEAGMIQDGSNARSAAKLAIIERAIGEVAERVVKLTEQFLTNDSVARVVGPDSAIQWVQYSKEDLQGDFDFSVEAGSTQPQNESSRRQSALQLMDAMSPFIGTTIDPHAMAEYVLRNGFGIKNPEDFFIAPPALQNAGIDPATGLPIPPPPEPGAPGAAPQGGAPAPQGAPAGPPQGNPMMPAPPSPWDAAMQQMQHS